MTDNTTTDRTGNLMAPEEIRQELIHLSLHLRDAIKITNTRASFARRFVGNDAVIMGALLEKVAECLGGAASTLEGIDRLVLQVATERTFDH